jgi:hypothetical protein
VIEPTSRAPQPPAEQPTSVVRLAFAWAFVAIPLAWGVYQTFVKSLALFD